MTSGNFESLKDFILTENSYLSTGYANAFKDSETSGIYARAEGNLRSIFPDDRAGNYFYLRNEPSVSFQTKPGLAECGINRQSYDDRLTCYLVAIVSEADEFTLIENLRNTCLKFKEMSAIPSEAMWQKENVIISEMQGFEDEEIMKALSNVKSDAALVKITLQITKEFIPGKCIVNPCNNCN